MMLCILGIFHLSALLQSHRYRIGINPLSTGRFPCVSIASGGDYFDDIQHSVATATHGSWSKSMTVKQCRVWTQ